MVEERVIGLERKNGNIENNKIETEATCSL